MTQNNRAEVSDALAPCPFCGTTLSVVRDYDGDPLYAHPDSDNCVLSGTSWDADEFDTAAWNRRFRPEPTSAVQVTEAMVEREVASADIEWEVHDDSDRAPRDFWHARITWRGLSCEWVQWGALGDFQRPVPVDIKAKVEGELRDDLRNALTAALSQSQPAPQPEKAGTFEFKGKTFYKGPIATDDFGTYRRISSTPPTEAGVEEPEKIEAVEEVRDITARGQEMKLGLIKYPTASVAVLLAALYETKNALTTERERSARLREALEAIELAARNLNKYLEWQLSPESPGYHPTFPSAVAYFRGQFEAWVFEPGHSRFEERQEDRRAALRELKGGE